MSDNLTANSPNLEDIVDLSSSEDYAEMPAGEVAYRAVTNLPGSVWEAGKGIVTAVTNPVETAKALGQAGYGFGSMAYGALGGEQDPKEKARNEALARAMIEPYTSVAAFKKELAENPAGPLSLVLPAAGGALTKAGQIAGTASRLGSAIGKVGRAVEASTSLVDPARALYETSVAARKFGPRAISATQSMLTGSPEAVFEKAFEAGAARGIDADKIRSGFNEFYSGKGNAIALSQDVEKAISSLRNKASVDWFNTRGQITGAATTPIDYRGIRSALDSAWKDFGGPPGTRTSAFPEERAALADAEKLIREYANNPPGMGKNNLAGLDELKRALQARADGSSSGSSNAYNKVRASVRETLGNVSPEYSRLMDDYQYMLDEINTLKKTLGAGERTDANAQLIKAMKAFKTPTGETMLEKISEIDPTIPYKIAGEALRQNPTGLRQIIVGGTPAAGMVANAVMSGDPIKLAAALPLFAAGAAASSPRIMGKGSYAAGRGAAALSAMGDIPLGPVSVGDVVSGIKKSAYPTALASEQLQFAREREDRQSPGLRLEGGDTLNISEPGKNEFFLEDSKGNRYDSSGNIIRKSGGRVDRKSGGRTTGNPISAEVKRVRALLSEKTASMLSVPDDAIATALHLAKRT